MPEFARKPAESYRSFDTISGTSLSASDLASEALRLSRYLKSGAPSEKTVRKMFEREPGVLHWGTEERLHKRAYRTLRVPETVLHRVHRKLRKAS